MTDSRGCEHEGTKVETASNRLNGVADPEGATLPLLISRFLISLSLSLSLYWCVSSYNVLQNKYDSSLRKQNAEKDSNKKIKIKYKNSVINTYEVYRYLYMWEMGEVRNESA